MIVSLLDIHTPVASPEGSLDEPLEILEAGTGHGSLTLHLARAINAANPCPPRIPSASQRQILDDSNSTGKSQTGTEDTVQREWDEWRAQRGAVLHTVDVNAKYSAHAEMVVRGFRRGLYAGNVDFYVSSVERWIEEQTRRRAMGVFSKTTKPFLSYAILDMPSAHLRIPHVASVLKPDGILAVFMPHITQIGDCVKLIREKRLPFVMDRTVELGTGISSGRLWDVRVAQTKSKSKLSSQAKEEEASEVADSDGSPSTSTDAAANDAAAETEKGESVLVCRPKVGEKIVGGGFVGIWKRMKN